MSVLYISAAQLISFHSNIVGLASVGTTYLEDNIIARTKMAIDRYCFTKFDTVSVTDQKYLDIQLAQKILAGKLYIREIESVKIARESVGKSGSERSGDWNYGIGEIEALIDKEIDDIIGKYRDWTQEDAMMIKTGRIVLDGDLLYDNPSDL